MKSLFRAGTGGLVPAFVALLLAACQPGGAPEAPATDDAGPDAATGTQAGDAAPGYEVPVRYHTLDNGLKVLIHEDDSTPMAAVNVLYNVGARDESPDKTGFAHLFEHLMKSFDRFRARFIFGYDPLPGFIVEQMPQFSQEFGHPVNPLGIPGLSLIYRAEEHLVHPETIRAILINHFIRIDDITPGFRHFVSF